MSRMVVEPASSSLRSGFSSPKSIRFKKGCFLIWPSPGCFFFLDFSGTAFAVFFGFFFTCIVLLLINAVNGRCHIENALRQTHTLAGFLVQNLIEQLEHKIIGILRLQYLQFT